jgi:predicted ester cyclase
MLGANDSGGRHVRAEQESGPAVLRPGDQRRDLDAVGDYFADERTAGWVRKGCFSFFQAFPDLHVALDEFVAEGDRVFLRSTMTGTHDGEFQGIPATGHHIAAESAEVFRIAGGKFVAYWCMVDGAGLMRPLTEEPVAARA